MAAYFFCHMPDTMAQVKIGDNPKKISMNAILELETKNKGLLLPRIALQKTTSPTPLQQFEEGILIYNNSTINDVSPGIYFSDGSKWIKLNNTAAISDSANKPNNPFLSGSKRSTIIVKTENQNIFSTPSMITNSNDIFLYRNGVLISFTINNPTSIKSEIPCEVGDQITIIQLL